MARDEGFRLLLQRLYDLRMGVSDYADSVAARAIHVFFAVDVPD